MVFAQESCFHRITLNALLRIDLLILGRQGWPQESLLRGNCRNPGANEGGSSRHRGTYTPKWGTCGSSADTVALLMIASLFGAQLFFRPG